jgi:hypothetical protein
MNCTVNKSFNKAVKARLAAPKTRGRRQVCLRSLFAAVCTLPIGLRAFPLLPTLGTLSFVGPQRIAPHWVERHACPYF